MGLDFSVVPQYADQLALGVLWTVLLTICAGALSFFGGIFFAVIALYSPWFLRYPVKALSFIFMGTPLLLQLFLMYFGLVQIGIDIPAFYAGVLGLGLHFAVYNSDIIQTGILAVDVGQSEAARALGLSRFQVLRYIVVPQAVRDMVPPIGNNMVALLKDSALVAIIGVSELVLASQLAIARTYRPFEFYITISVLYYLINLCLEFVVKRFEHYMAQPS